MKSEIKKEFIQHGEIFALFIAAIIAVILDYAGILPDRYIPIIILVILCIFAFHYVRRSFRQEEIEKKIDAIETMMGSFRPEEIEKKIDGIETMMGLSLEPQVLNEIKNLDASLKSIKGKSKPLFQKIVEFKMNRFFAETPVWATGRMDFLPDEVEKKGIDVFKGLQRGGFVTFLVDIQSFWDVQKDYHAAGRRVAKTKKIQRVFILEDESLLFHKNLLDQIEADTSSGIQTRIAMAKNLPEEMIRDFGLWDDEVLCEVHYNKYSRKVTGGTFSIIETDLAKARLWRDSILSRSQEAAKVMEHYESDSYKKNKRIECLVASAPLMHQYSDSFCKGGYLDPESCKWYHSAWQYLRIVDKVSNPEWHNSFFIRELKRHTRENQDTTILISGTADYGMLAHVLDAFNDLNIRYKIIILDICETPLKICEWYAKFKNAHNITTIKKNILASDLENQSVDIIVTDAFLTRFQPEQRQKIVAEWYRILKTNGVILTTIRINGDGKMTKASKTEVQTYVSDVNNKFSGISSKIELNALELESMAKEYIRRMISYPLPGENEIRKLFQNFITTVTVVQTPGEVKPTNYAQVVAIKR